MKQTRVGAVERMKWMGFRPVAEAAVKVGLSVSKISQMLEGGTLAGVQEGPHRYVRWSTLRARFPQAFAGARKTGARLG